ncbi:hypothetical protein CEY12_20355 [Chryseobacterium sp. T16E-39]|uniref:hypothetical protein n=1 Tax=Chryseobacterium sp. T16E-39 TaxID=2015076 RepID=UPI000B5B3628|nr:hypothetical protein [Chryseobacterium sp. T16E-39]ASK32292.1 hypothetical protein CEY12_20355 [Chryseobacterium sp. T16E-39]
MNTKIYLYGILFSFLFSIHVEAQVRISTTPGLPHANALLDIKDSKKGVIFTKADNISGFPLYNALQEDLFNDLPSLEGAIVYNKEDKQYYKYDGTVWSPALQLGGFYNPFETRKNSSNSESWTCIGVLGISTCDISALLGNSNRKTISISNTINRSQLLVNNLNLTAGSNFVTIPSAGLYYISGVIGFGGTSILGLGSDVSYWVNLDVSYDNGNTWATLAYSETLQYGGIFIDLGQAGNKSASVSSTVTLPANARIRLAAMVSTSATISNYFSSIDHRDTFINIQKLK